MRRVLVAATLLLCTVVASASPGNAASRLALVLGNADYEFGKLKNPVNDAVLIAASLREVGFEVFEHTDADARQMKRAIVGFGKALADAGKDAVGLVYYAGHGVQYAGENYMIPIGAQIEDELDVDIEGIRASTLLAALDRAGNSLNIVILDACRNNPFAAGSRSAASGLARMDAPSGTLLAYSTSPGKVAVDGTGKNSPYTRALARAIKTPGAKVEDVFKSVRISVMDRTSDKQVPWEASSLTGDFFFVDAEAPAQVSPQTAALAPSGSDSEIEYWKSIANSDNPALFSGYIDRFPDGIFTAIAEERIRQLTDTKNSPNQQTEVVYFQTIQNSDNPADFEAYLTAYPNGIFAAIAQQRIATLQSQQAQRTLGNGNAVEKELWNEVKETNDPALVEAFLESHPDSIYAKLAQARLSSLKEQQAAPPAPAAPQVASASPAITLAPSVSSTWKGVAKTNGQAGWGINWCRSGYELPMEVIISNGSLTGSISKKDGGRLGIRGTLRGNDVVASLPSQYAMRGKIDDHVLRGKIRPKANAALCRATYVLERVD